MATERRQSGQTQDWWAVTSIHEAAHGMAAFALGCHPVELRLDRRAACKGSSLAGVCVAVYEKSYYGDVAKLMVTNAPFTAHQYECLPAGEKGDLHEREGCQQEFAKMIGGWDAQLFSRLIDAPLLAFFSSNDIQAATIVLARWLYERNKLSLKQVGQWYDKLELPEAPCKRLAETCLTVATAVKG